jgi:hypothetical protein
VILILSRNMYVSPIQGCHLSDFEILQYGVFQTWADYLERVVLTSEGSYVSVIIS